MDDRATRILGAALAVQTMAAEHQRIAALSLADEGVDAAATGLMWVLASVDEPLGMHEIAARLDCDPSNVTLLQRRLRRLELVEQRTDPHDGRRRLLVLTGPGRRVARAMIEAVVSRSPLASLGDDRLGRLERVLADSLEEPPPPT